MSSERLIVKHLLDYRGNYQCNRIIFKEKFIFQTEGVRTMGSKRRSGARLARLLWRYIANKYTTFRYAIYRIKESTIIISLTIFGVAIYLALTHFLLSSDYFLSVITEHYSISSDKVDDFIISQKASSIDNSLVIFCVSLGLSIWKASDPSLETLDKRIAFIFPKIDSSQGLKFIKKHLQKLATISPRSRITFQIDEMDEKNKLIKAEMIYECSISNLHNQDPLNGKDIEFGFELSSDASKALKNKFPDVDSIVWGKVSEIRTISPKTSDKWYWHTKGHHMLIDGHGHSTKKFPLNNMIIPPNEEAQLDCIWSFWSYSDGKSFDTFGCFRFTKKLETFFVNNLNKKITVEALILHKSDFNKKPEAQWQEADWESEVSKMKLAEHFTQKIAPPCPDGNHILVGEDNANRVAFRYEDFSNDHLMIWRIKFD